MHNIGMGFEVLEASEAMPVGWSKVTGHMVFDVKMESFIRKARWVLDGHRTPDVEGSTYAGVFSRESVRIALTYATLNGLHVCAADIRNAYLQAPSSQNDFIICGPEFGLEHVGKRAKIHRALYGGKAAGRDFQNHLGECMCHLGYSSCLADPDVWMQAATKPDGATCYKYVLLYVDDALAIGVNAEKMLREEVGKYFELKEVSIGTPKLYLGAQMREVILENGATAWGISSSQYVQAAVHNVERYLEEHDIRFPNKAKTPMRTSYSPELDVSKELDAEEHSYFQSLIGTLRWIVELGRVDICLEVSLLSSHLALPWQGHLEQALHIFAYLQIYHNTELVLDPSDPVIDETLFERRDWSISEFGHKASTETLPGNMPEPRGQGFVICAKVDADHTGDCVSQRSRTGFLVWINSAMVFWMSKKQTSVETSSFGSEFIAMKQCCKYIRGLWYKLRMMGIPCESPAFVYGDNQSVLANTTIPESVLKKKSQSIAYHFVREGSACDEWWTGYVSTHENESDLLTKVLPNGAKRRGFVRNLLHHIF
jgi:Reverse transcriptase (RNA-dependent DNA polymerase)